MPPFTSTQAQSAHSDAETGQRVSVTWVLPAVAASAQSARRQVGDLLQAWDLRHLVEDAELIVSELVTNAICHGSDRDPIWHTVRRIRMATGDVIRLEVGDYGRGWSGVLSPPESDGDIPCSGRGLYLVEALSSGWGTWNLPHGHAVWAALPIGGDLSDSAVLPAPRSDPGSS